MSNDNGPLLARLINRVIEKYGRHVEFITTGASWIVVKIHPWRYLIDVNGKVKRLWRSKGDKVIAKEDEHSACVERILAGAIRDAGGNHTLPPTIYFESPVNGDSMEPDSGIVQPTEPAAAGSS